MKLPTMGTTYDDGAFGIYNVRVDISSNFAKLKSLVLVVSIIYIR